ncbi:MAG TPA: metalloregulator ArsR/SmtB family transcription factor [Vicinamibacteria bacterium]|nr:metalloregulator ArsR/SmtB family transcription factor [Vicinamibacteria bacterium]
MESLFEVLAERNRREILRLLVERERSVGDLERQLNRPQPTISKHLRVLREAGLVDSRVEAQKRVYRVRLEPLLELEEWLKPFRRLWTERLDALESHLDRMPDMPKKKGRKR